MIADEDVDSKGVCDEDCETFPGYGGVQTEGAAGGLEIGGWRVEGAGRTIRGCTRVLGVGGVD